MIKNERQYRITKAQAEKLDAALKVLSARSAGDLNMHPRLIKAQKDGLRSQLDSLHRELREFKELKEGKQPPPDLRYIAVLPRDLIRARIASRLSQKELARRLGIPEQQIQRYEALEYESVSLRRISEIAEVLQAAKRRSAGPSTKKRIKAIPRDR